MTSPKFEARIFGGSDEDGALVVKADQRTLERKRPRQSWRGHSAHERHQLP